MIRTLYCLEPQRGDVSQVCTLRLLVHRALVKSRVFRCGGVDCVHVHYWQQGEEDLRLGLDQFAATAIPSSTIQVQTIDVDTLL